MKTNAKILVVILVALLVFMPALITAKGAEEAALRQAKAKGSNWLVRIIIDNPRMGGRLVVEDKTVLNQFDPWRGQFLSRPLEYLPGVGNQIPYQIYYYREHKSSGESEFYYMFYYYPAADPVEEKGRGYIYLPGRGDPYYSFNGHTITRKDADGRWHRASPAWEKAFRDLLPAHEASSSSGQERPPSAQALKRWLLSFDAGWFTLPSVRDRMEGEHGSKAPPAAVDAPQESCPVTQPPDPPFVPPPSYPENYPYQRKVWYGTAELWTAIPENGEWDCLFTCPNGDKMFWWREGYVYSEEPRPDLQVTGKRLDGSGKMVVLSSEATNAFHPDFGSAMLVGGQVPTPGCWEITGHYREDELSFIVRAGD